MIVNVNLFSAASNWLKAVENKVENQVVNQHLHIALKLSSLISEALKCMETNI